MVRWISASVLALLIGCEIDSSKLDRLACDTGSDCTAPDLDCVDGYCVASPCSAYTDCGDGFQFVCDDGLCRAVDCGSGASCATGFECVGGFCTGEGCGDEDDGDEDGFLSIGCGGRDCDDQDATVNPDAREGGGQFDDTCSDDEDNDCDGLTDRDDDACGPCSVDEDCDDGNACTTETCLMGDCLASPRDGEACDDGDPCTTGDVCDIVICGGEPYSCDDGLDCTTDSCDGTGGCTSATLAGSCLTDGQCFADGDPNPSNDCERCDAAAAPTAWSSVTEGPCDDGDPCTSGDSCSAGGCDGEPYTCDDGMTCTIDVCDGAGGCDVEVVAGSCLVEGSCLQDGDPNPSNVCERCDAGVSQVAFSPDDLAIPDDGADCTVDSCLGGETSHDADDGRCADAEVCAPCAGTVTGCVAPPPSLALACPATADRDEPGASCSVDLGGVAGADACLSCASLLGFSTLFREDFTGCPDLEAAGWTVSGNPACPIDLGVAPDPLVAGDALEAEAGTWTLTRTVDTTDLDSLRLCFDYADDNAGPNDSLAIELDADGSFDEIFDDDGGPVVEVDDTWSTFCLDLVDIDPRAADNPALGVRIRATAQGADDNVYLDRLVLEGWQADSVTFGTLSTDDFAGCDLGSWSATGDPVGCPVAGGPFDGADAVFASSSAWSLSRPLDASTACEDLTVSFAYGTDGATGSDSIGVGFRADGGPFVLAWATLGPPGPEGILQRYAVDLAHVDPAVRFDPEVEVEVSANAGGGTVVVDDFEASGATCGPGDAVLAIAGPSDAGGGQYDLTVASQLRTRAYLTCEWDDRAELRDRATIDFVP
ncbi:MAG: hypothetical protein HYY06_15315 [Deltaproteobacteria bacterium]|nr:hypothetical protein [Deltaproteobacteria bacterium]